MLAAPRGVAAPTTTSAAPPTATVTIGRAVTAATSRGRLLGMWRALGAVGGATALAAATRAASAWPGAAALATVTTGEGGTLLGGALRL